jgi:ABC-type multidrug transport system ATPase subunit
MISINNLSKKFKTNIIYDDVSIKFENNINFLFGNNGCGKSTLINIIAGASPSDEGSIFIGDSIISLTDGTYKKKIGFLLSLPSYPIHYKVSEYINLINYIYDNNFQLNSLYQKNLIDFFDLNKYLNTKINELSVGYIKRVQLLTSMLHDPKYYILDEPFAGLDNNFIQLLNQKIIDLSKEGKYFLVTTHQIDNTLFNYLNSDRFEIVDHKIKKIFNY